MLEMLLIGIYTLLTWLTKGSADIHTSFQLLPLYVLNVADFLQKYL